MANATIDAYLSRAGGASLESTVSAESLELRRRIALTCRFLADDNHSRNLAGQISVRLDDDTYWTTRFGTGFRDAKASNLVRVDRELELIEGEGNANPAIRSHIWIYDRRPEINCIIHGHPPYASALAAAGVPLRPSHVDMMMFYDDCAHLETWPGVLLQEEEAPLIGTALGDKHCVLLASHGVQIAGESLAHGLYLAAHLEYAAQIQVHSASLVGTPPVIDHEKALAAREFTMTQKFVDLTFDYWCREAAAKHPDALD